MSQMDESAVRCELTEQRQRYEIMEKDLFKAQTEARKLQAQYKQLLEVNQKFSAGNNNTSSNFTLPSEFKKLWDELVKEGILDAFPDFLENYKHLVGLI